MTVLTYFKKRKFASTFLLLLVLIFLVLLSISIAISLKHATNSFSKSPQPLLSSSPTVSTYPSTQTARDILLERKENRVPLSAQDQKSKTKILQLLPQDQQAGILHEEATYRIEYIESLDLFKVEILTPHYENAQQESTDWFRSQGMSQQGICNAPISFYLNYDINRQLGEKAKSFKPLPPGC